MTGRFPVPTPRRPGGPRRGRRGGVARCGLALGVFVGALALAGCTTPRNVLGPTANRCYRAVAVARLALHREGRFAGVRALPATSVKPVLAEYHPETAGRVALAPSTALCLVAYEGTFRASALGSVLEPGPATGRLAVVVVRQRDERVLGTLLMNRPTRRLVRVFPLH